MNLVPTAKEWSEAPTAISGSLLVKQPASPRPRIEMAAKPETRRKRQERGWCGTRMSVPPRPQTGTTCQTRREVHHHHGKSDANGDLPLPASFQPDVGPSVVNASVSKTMHSGYPADPPQRSNFQLWV
jgi:hypothetical protein